jgi:putative ABC transport system permease protein
MVRSYLKIAFRHLLQHKTITLINIGGLAIGMACCMLIVLFVQDERSFNNFHANGENIYRLNCLSGQKGEIDHMSITQFPAGPALKAELSDVKMAVRVTEQGSPLFAYNGKKFIEKQVAYVDPDFFRMFSFPLVAGNTATALKEPNTVVISESIARKYFGNQDAVGKVLRMENKTDCRVTAVMKDMPLNSDMQYDMLLSYSTFEKGQDLSGEWFNFSSNYTYLLLHDQANMAKVNRELQLFTDRHVKDIATKLGFTFSYQLQPLANIHLHPRGDGGDDNRLKLIYVYVAIAIFIILIACINFMNLATARAGERSMEVGLRKVMGAPRKALVIQFLMEAVLLSLMAFVIALLIARLLLPAFNDITDKSLHLFGGEQVPLLGLLLLVAVFTGLLAGSYPALFLSGFVPIAILKGTFQSLRNKTFLRKVLVVSQFVIAIVLIVSTIVVYRQLRYWQQQNLGLNKEYLLNVYLYGVGDMHKKQLMKEEMLRYPAVKEASLSNMALGRFITNFNPVINEGESVDKSITAGIIKSDFNLIQTLGMKLVKGRAFSEKMGMDSTSSFIVNEAAAKALGLKDPVGRRIEWLPGYTDRKGPIVGVVKDFNYQTLRLPVRPVIYIVDPGEAALLTLRLQPGAVDEQLARLNSIWDKLVPDYPFQYSFVGDDLAKQYLNEQRLGTLFGAFAVLSVFIACMGLFGLSILISRQRTKEIGIRKILGASVGNITALLSKDFLRLVFVALLIATPVAWYLMSQWLQNFAYRINVEWWMFVAAGLCAVVIALFTISFQSVKAALMNPVKSLRTE